MQEEAVHSFVHSFVHSLPPCTLAWHILACHVSMLTWLPGLPVWLLSAPSEPQGHCARWILSPELTALLSSPWGNALSLQARMDPCGAGSVELWRDAGQRHPSLLSSHCPAPLLPGCASTCTSMCAPEHVCICITRDVFRYSTHVLYPST